MSGLANFSLPKITVGPVIKHIALAGTLVGTAWLLFPRVAESGADRSREWLGLLTPDSVVEVAGVHWSSQERDAAATDAMRNRLQDTRNRMRHHLDVAVYFQSHYYAAIIFSAVLGLATAVVGVVVTKKGWDSAHPLLVNALLILAALGILFLSFPNMFQQETNAETNLRQAVLYGNLDRNIATYLDTGQFPPSGATDFDSVVVAIDRRLVENSSIVVGFDIGGLPTAGQLRELLGQVAPGPGGS